MDKDLKALRNARWDKAFAESRPDDDNSGVTTTHDGTLATNTNRKATIVIEHLIQASDVAHTMQHWHIYRRWNQRLFEEMFVAYQEGRSDTDPSVNWYKGEMGFFDFYILPLAQKLKDCGVFGVSSDEYMCYAQENQREWESRGQELVEKAQRKYANRPNGTATGDHRWRRQRYKAWWPKWWSGRSARCTRLNPPHRRKVRQRRPMSKS